MLVLAPLGVAYPLLLLLTRRSVRLLACLVLPLLAAFLCPLLPLLLPLILRLLPLLLPLALLCDARVPPDGLSS